MVLCQESTPLIICYVLFINFVLSSLYVCEVIINIKV